MKKAFFVSLSLLVLLGAGCVNDGGDVFLGAQQENNDNPVTDTDKSSTYMALSCDDGLKLYQSTEHNIEFCYPEKNGNEGDAGVIAVQDDTDGVVLSVDGQAMRKVWVENVDENTSREDVVESYAIQNPPDAVCGVVGISDEIEGRHGYMIVGEDMSGEQNLGSVTACTYNEAYEQDGFDMNEERSGLFYFYDRVPGVMFVLTGEQDASLGVQANKFMASLQPKE